MQTVSNKFREREYSGGALYKCHLTINNTSIPIEQIAKITINSPIIDDRSEVFYVGTFISQTIKIKFKNLDGIDIKSNYEVSLSIGQDIYDEEQETTTEEIVPMGVYLIDDLAENYQTTCEITCMDYAVKFKPNIDYSPCFVNDKADVNTIIEYICDYFDVTLGTDLSTLPNPNVEVGTYDSTVSGKQWLSYLAEIKGCNLKMSRTGELLFIPFKKTQPDITINALASEKFELGEKYKITRVLYFDAIRNYTYGNDTANTLFIRQDNPFVTDTNVVKNVYDAIKNFEIWSIKNKNYGDVSLDAWDLIQFTLGTDENDNPITYQTYNNNTLNYEMNISTEINTQIPTKQKEVTTNVVGGNTDTKIKRLRTTVDSLNNQVQIVVEEQDEQEQQMSELTQTVEQIQSQIQDIPTITSEAQGTGRLYLANLAETRIINFKVHPTTEDIVGLFASPLLHAQDGLTGLARGITFEGSKYIYYKFPKDLLYYNNVADEFVYDGIGEKMYIIHKIGLDENNNKFVLGSPITEYFEFEDIYISEGNNYVYLDSYPTAYIYIKAMIKNDYTDSFATKVELNSSITQTADEINLEVSKKVDETEIISKINQSPEEIDILARRIKFEGEDITINSGDISGFGISNEKFYKGLLGKYGYTIEDATLTLLLYLGFLNQGTILDKIMDYNNSGTITLADVVSITNIVALGYENTRIFDGKFEINSDDLKNCIKITKNNEVVTSIGLGGINTDFISTKNFVCGITDPSSETIKFIGTCIRQSDGQILIQDENNVRTIIEAGKITLDDGNGNTKVITATS